mmetsp:Transcript_19307/g.49587  ORF Transcript_19307/g.49587 Transcript_19307/m.49587 type:complete len:273 (+) Transcript_19307:4042-4860(+)
MLAESASSASASSSWNRAASNRPIWPAAATPNASVWGSTSGWSSAAIPCRAVWRPFMVASVSPWRNPVCKESRASQTARLLSSKWMFRFTDSSCSNAPISCDIPVEFSTSDRKARDTSPSKSLGLRAGGCQSGWTRRAACSTGRRFSIGMVAMQSSHEARSWFSPPPSSTPGSRSSRALKYCENRSKKSCLSSRCPSELYSMHGLEARSSFSLRRAMMICFSPFFLADKTLKFVIARNRLWSPSASLLVSAKMTSAPPSAGGSSYNSLLLYS